MRYCALASDYDGTLATSGRVDSQTRDALQQVRRSGRKLLLVTGRELEDLKTVFSEFELFDLIVAENGAVLFDPQSRQESILGGPPPERLVDALRARGVQPLHTGRSVIATWHPYETAALDAIRELGLEHNVIFNKGSVMILPAGVNKATGLRAALTRLHLSPHNCVGVGDAENDHAFLDLCECSVAVANALPSLKERADWVTNSDHGAGVRELIDQLIKDDLAKIETQRRDLLLGRDDQGREIRVAPQGACILIAGPSGSGKSSSATALLERLLDAKYQACVIDPEGDYENFPGLVGVGDAQHAPRIDEVMQLIEDDLPSPEVNLLGIPLADRPAFFSQLLLRLLDSRAHFARPHWLLIDEAHHMLPKDWKPAPESLPQTLAGAILITVHPNSVAKSTLERVDTVIAVGDSATATLNDFCAATGRPTPKPPNVELDRSRVLYWQSSNGSSPIPITLEPARAERQRHRRKYAEGDLHENSFVFKGPENRLQLRAQNLNLFVQMAEGVDDDTWLFHLHQGDYSRWIRQAIKDEELASEIEQIERSNGSADETRNAMREAVERRYTKAA